jgi:hypothetical protein
LKPIEYKVGFLFYREFGAISLRHKKTLNDTKRHNFRTKSTTGVKSGAKIIIFAETKQE